ncbi:MAG: response regulator, partial [Candidatus Aminicenantes bacterium]|nr:response regulator [Candidatus Aminicenantes bacterium]
MSDNTILIIDDDQVTTAVIEEYLVDFGLKVIKAQNGDAGIGIMKKSNPDLILLDIMMDDIEGTEVCRIIKADEKISHIPVFALTV